MEHTEEEEQWMLEQALAEKTAAAYALKDLIDEYGEDNIEAIDDELLDEIINL